MKIIVINSLQNNYIDKCTQSLKETAPGLAEGIVIVREDEFREQTLNVILNQFGQNDLLIIADDIIFRGAWSEALNNAIPFGDVIGFSMLKPDSNIIHNTGYELVSSDGAIFFKAFNQGKLREKVPSFNYKECDAVTGCAMFIKKKVIASLQFFPLDGKNRWGENIYLHQARNKGFKVMVLGHYLYHYGKSTKSNSNFILRSESYTYEKGMWKTLVEKYIDKSKIRKKYFSTLTEELKQKVLSSKNCLFYGAGTVSELIINQLKNDKYFPSYSICSGLQEEKGLLFCGKEIKYAKDISFSKFDIVIITVIQKEKQIYNILKEHLMGSKVYFISREEKGFEIVYNIQEIV